MIDVETLGCLLGVRMVKTGPSSVRVEMPCQICGEFEHAITCPFHDCPMCAKEPE